MALWRVDVAGVSLRYVEADDAASAVDLVYESIRESLDLRAAPASRELARRYEKAGPLTRKRLLVAMDGLVPFKPRKSPDRIRAQLERLLRHEESRREWMVASMPARLPTPDPEAMDSLLRASEAMRIAAGLERLKSSERKLPPEFGVR